MAKIKVLALDVQGDKGLHEIVIDSHDLDAIYKELKCDTFDIAVRKIGGRYYDIFCDDEGLYVENPIVSAIEGGGQVMLVGNLLITRNDGPETIGLSDIDIEIIRKNTIKLIDESGKIHTALYPVEY